MLDVRRLRLLCDLAHLGTIAAVARSHTYTPSAVSQQLAALEREAGVPLLERTGRRVALTPAGVVLVRHAEKVLTALEARAATGRGPGARLRHDAGRAGPYPRRGAVAGRNRVPRRALRRDGQRHGSG